MSSLFVARCHRLVSRTLPRVFSIASQKGTRKAKPKYESVPSSASKFMIADMEALGAIFKPASENEVIPDVKGKNFGVNNPLSKPILII